MKANQNSPRGAADSGLPPVETCHSYPRAGIFVRLRCLLGGHEWTGMQFQPMAYIRCRRCGWLP